jgi:Super-infection exclusion protein B
MGPLELIAGWLLKAYRESPRFMVILFGLSAALLLLPTKLLAMLSLQDFSSHNRSWIALVFLFSALFTISYPIERGAASGYSFARGAIYRHRIKKRLANLDSREKAILKSYISRNVRTQHYQYDLGTVANLRGCRILFITTTPFDWYHAPHTIPDMVWEYLAKHPELLG